MKNDKNLYKIGAVAKMFNISISTLRNYEKIGLLCPEFVDEESGYRYYGAKQFERLNIIKYLRVLDLSVASIRDFLTYRDVEKIRKQLIEQKNLIEKKKNELNIIQRKIEKRLKTIENAVSSVLETIIIKEVPQCRVAYVQNCVNPINYFDLESSLREIDKSGKNDPIIFSGKVGVGISAKSLATKDFSKYDIVFILLDEEDIFVGQSEIIPKEKCVSIRYCGTHKDSKKYYEKLCAYIEEKNLQISGFSKEITMIDYSLSNKEEQFVTEISIPIKEKHE